MRLPVASVPIQIAQSSTGLLDRTGGILIKSQGPVEATSLASGRTFHTGGARGHRGRTARTPWTQSVPRRPIVLIGALAIWSLPTTAKRPEDRNRSSHRVPPDVRRSRRNRVDVVRLGKKWSGREDSNLRPLQPHSHRAGHRNPSFSCQRVPSSDACSSCSARKKLASCHAMPHRAAQLVSI
jgi:hypothetical protein